MHYVMYSIWLFVMYSTVSQAVVYGKKFNIEMFSASASSLILSIAGVRPFVQVTFLVLVCFIISLVNFILDIKYIKD